MARDAWEEWLEQEHLLYEDWKLWILTECRKQQRFFDSWIADSVIIMRSDFLMPLLFVWTMHHKPGSVFRVNRGQQETRLKLAQTCMTCILWPGNNSQTSHSICFCYELGKNTLCKLQSESWLEQLLCWYTLCPNYIAENLDLSRSIWTPVVIGHLVQILW